MEPLLSFRLEIDRTGQELFTSEGRANFLNSEQGKKKMAEYAKNYETLRSSIIEAVKLRDAKITSLLPSDLEKGDIVEMFGSINNTTEVIYVFDGKQEDHKTETTQFLFHELGRGKEFAYMVASKDNFKIGKIEFIDKIKKE